VTSQTASASAISDAATARSLRHIAASASWFSSIGSPVHSVIRPAELIAATTLTGGLDMARDALGRLAEWTQIGGIDWAQGIEVHCRALLADGEAAEALYQEAIGRFSQTRPRSSLARPRLLYGEWLRREGPRLDAREQFRTAHDMFDAAGMEGFAARAHPTGQP
jgi:hypothetical protein